MNLPARLHLIGLCFVAAASVPSGGAAAQSEGEIIISHQADPKTCNPASASTVAFETIIREHRTMLGRCVAVQGYWQERALFMSKHDADKTGSVTSDSLQGRRIGIYGSERMLLAAPETAELAVAVGVVGDCDRLWEGATLVIGYCHYTRGPYLSVTQIGRRIELPPIR